MHKLGAPRTGRRIWLGVVTSILRRSGGASRLSGPHRAAVPMAAALVLVSACSASTPPSNSRVDPKDPGQVAIAYTLAATRGDYDTARAFVRAEDQGVIDALALGTKGVEGITASGDISVGRVSIAGDIATVSWVGRLCRVAKDSAKQQTNDCVHNDDPAAQSPLFLVHLVRSTDDHWLVALGGT